MERQRQAHDEERALWNTERMELQDRIAELEGSLRRHQAISSSQLSSPMGLNGSRENNNFWGLLSVGSSRHTSANTTGDEVWRGPKPDVQPSRTFSDISNQSARPESRLPSIAEDLSYRSRGESSQGSTSTQTLKHKPSINGVHIDKNLDGINFKPSGIPPEIITNAMTPQSASPKSPSPANVSPGTMPMPLVKLGVQDPYTQDAGHTPLARRTYFNNDGTSDSSTPKQADEQLELQRLLLEPHTTSVRPPSERSNSYFPAPPDPPEDEDPALQGPLGLTNSQGNDNHFLNELDGKLLQAAVSGLRESPAEASASDVEKAQATNGDEDRDFEQLEHEPKLRIKRSMNFGSAFGSKNCGKGF